VAAWAIALSVGISLTRPSDLRVRVPARGDDAVFRRVRWSGQSLVAPPWYSVRVSRGALALDYTHYKIIAATQDTVRETGTWHGAAVDEDVRLNRRIEHFEVSHGVNAVAVLVVFRNPSKRGVYGAVGPVVYVPHAESTVDGVSGQWGYGVGGFGAEAVVGTGGAHRFAEVKYDAGRIAVGVANGTATTPLQTLHAALSP
jgi:hypothetical protein